MPLFRCIFLCQIFQKAFPLKYGKIIMPFEIVTPLPLFEIFIQSLPLPTFPQISECLTLCYSGASYIAVSYTPRQKWQPSDRQKGTSSLKKGPLVPLSAVLLELLANGPKLDFVTALLPKQQFMEFLSIRPS